MSWILSYLQPPLRPLLCHLSSSPRSIGLGGSARSDGVYRLRGLLFRAQEPAGGDPQDGGRPGISTAQLGLFLTAHDLLYGVAKFGNGVLADRSNPRYFMAAGLLLSALCNLAFGLSSGLALLGLWWLINGWFQGMGFPPCARVLSHWVGERERGVVWGIWNSSHQVGAALILSYRARWSVTTAGERALWCRLPSRHWSACLLRIGCVIPRPRWVCPRRGIPCHQESEQPSKPAAAECE